MPPTVDSAGLHNYHHHHPPQPQPPPSHLGASMAPQWNPAPSPYGENHEHRPPPSDPIHQQPYPPQNYPPPALTQNPPAYASDHAYSRQGSTSASTRSPPNVHYPPSVNGGSHDPQYYQPPPPPDYRGRPPYGPPDTPSNGAQPPQLQISTSHEMMPGQPQGPPSAHYGPPPTHSAGPPPQTPQYWPSYDMYTGQRRKPVRAAQACDSCRQRKAKCDEGRPECSHCKDNNLKCTYRDVPPQKAEKQVLLITDKLELLSDSVQQMMSAWKAQEDKINRILNMQESQASQMHAIVTSIPEDQKPPTGAGGVKFSNIRSQTRDESRQDPVYHNPNLSFSSSAISATGGDTAREGAPRKAHLPASTLLDWPSIKDIVPPGQTASYVMDTESERGLLRFYGCGEGEDKGDGHDGAPSPTTTSSSTRPEDESSSSPSGVWGTGQLPTRNPDHNHPAREHPGGVSPGGELILDCEIVDRYVKCYLDNMHILHPFLETRVLRKMVHAFKRKHSWDYRSLQRLPNAISGKRKREMSDSPGSVLVDGYGHPTLHHGQPRPINPTVPIEHSVANAIILLVIALGKICAHKEPLPGPVNSSTIRTSTPHTAYSDFPMTVSASAPTSPFSGSVGQLNGIPTSVAHLQGKNMDTIPGLAYFAKAADILGELPGGIDVSHVQANLLAGLYMGQLARIIPSHWYIANACRACQFLISSKPYQRDEMSPARRNLINFAFWSCLQLESDILAEVEFPASGIVAKEGTMHREMPTGLTLADTDKEDISQVQGDVLRYYSLQIQLRRTINDALNNLYNPDKANAKPSRSVIEILSSGLENWRDILKEWNWDDDNHESLDINTARMRGKYYGAKYIIHRPALQYALNNVNPSTPMSRPPESPLGQDYHSEFPSPATARSHSGNTPSARRIGGMRPPTKTHEPLERWIFEACQNCIQAAIRSTTAFDRVPPRLIITNIFGTAHAQFGNVLVLAATFNSSHPELKSLVDESTLRKLFDRTIAFLLRNEPISPVLGRDARILQYVKARLFPIPSYNTVPGSTTSSFSSR